MFRSGGRVLRALSPPAAANWERLSATPFFQDTSAAGRLVGTRSIEPPDGVVSEGHAPWSAWLEHDPVPFVSYPYEWCFGMLRDAALLQLDLLLGALDHELTLKDATPYNVQWQGSHPVFIDIPSFVPLEPGEPWVGYRQFCEMYLYPLQAQAYRGIEFQPLLRGQIDGIPVPQSRALFSWLDLRRPGVFKDVFLHSAMQSLYKRSEKDLKRDVGGQIRSAGFNRELIRANARRLRRIVQRLGWRPRRSTWSEYYGDNSYEGEEAAQKIRFVSEVAAERDWGLVWDLGCNTGRFSEILAGHARYVLAVDADPLVVETFYRRLKAGVTGNVLPLVFNVADPSPDLGWRGQERESLVKRGKPELTLCLALIHHLVITASIPMTQVLDWLADTTGRLVIELVTEEDPMTQVLLAAKRGGHHPYSLALFNKALADRFRILKREPLARGRRVLYYAEKR